MYDMYIFMYMYMYNPKRPPRLAGWTKNPTAPRFRGPDQVRDVATWDPAVKQLTNLEPIESGFINQQR